MNIPPLNPTSWSINSLFRKTENITKKVMQSKIPKTVTKKTYTQEYIMELLSKEKIKRTKIDIRILSDYLSGKYDYFKKLKENSENSKLEKLVGVLNLETFQEDEAIIRFGEEGDKFYILLSGKVNLYKTVYPQKMMTLTEYLSYMQNIVNIEGNQLKFERIKEKNQFLNLDMDSLMMIPPESFQNKAQMNVFTEEEEKLCEFGDGFAFGEIALLKQTKRNATIKAQTLSKLVSIEKSDYNKIIKELEEKRLEKELNSFKLNYPLFENWTLNHLIRLFNCFSQETLLSGQYLYKQNEDSDYIYIIESGKFELFSLLSFGWINDFYNYIIDAKNNLVNFVDKKKPLKETELVDVFEKAQERALPSPCKYDPLRISKIITSFPKKDTFLKIKNDEEELVDPFNLFKVKVRVLEQRDVLGIEDALEMKKRFYSVKCISSFGEVKKVKLYDFFRLINYLKEPKSKQVLKDIIAEKKSILYRQLKKAISKKFKGQEEIFAEKISNFLNDNNDNEKTNEITDKEGKLPLSSTHQLLQIPKIIDQKLMPLFFNRSNTKKDISNQGLILSTDNNICTRKKKEIRLKSNMIINYKLSSSPVKTPQQTALKEHNTVSLLSLGKKQKSLDTKKKSESSSLNMSNVPPSTFPSSPNHINRENNYQANLYLWKHRLLSPDDKKSNFITFNLNKEQKKKDFEESYPSTHSKIVDMNNTNSRNSNAIITNDTSNSLNYLLYRKSIGKSYDLLQTEIFKLTGTKRITPKKEILYHVYDDNDEKIIQIESSGNKTITNENLQFSEKKIKSDNNRSYINQSILAKIRCKNFKFLRKKKSTLF